MQFPTERMVEAAARAALKALRANPHIYSHSLRYIPDRQQEEVAKRIARRVLYASWSINEGQSDDFACRLAHIAETMLRD